MKLRLSLFLAIAFAAAAAAEEPTNSRQLNIASNLYCFLTGSPVALIFQAFDFVCRFTSSNTLEDTIRFNTARATLANTIYFTQEELEAVSIRHCSLFDFTDGTAFATNERNIWYPADLRGDDDLNTATQLAHQMGHVRQYQRGFWDFKCSYFQELLRTGFSFDRDNEVEQEAFELEDRVTTCLETRICV